MITAFKPSKPDRPRTHCLKQDNRMKNRIPFVNDENSERNLCSYCISKTYCHLEYKNGGCSTIGCTRPQKQHVQKKQNINTAHIAIIEYYILHVIYHMNSTQVMSAILNHDFNTKPYVKALQYCKTSCQRNAHTKIQGLM